MHRATSYAFGGFSAACGDALCGVQLQVARCQCQQD